MRRDKADEKYDRSPRSLSFSEDRTGKRGGDGGDLSRERLVQRMGSRGLGIGVCAFLFEMSRKVG